MKIGQTAELAGVSAQTIRFYEKKGLLPRVERTDGGYRRFGSDAVRRIRFIKHAQEVGFSLSDIANLLSLRTDPSGSCADVRRLTREKISELEERMRKLRAMNSTLKNLAARCEEDLPASACPILDAFDETEAASKNG